MRFTLIGLAVALCALLIAATPAFADSLTPQVDLPLTRAVLYASGVGYFEHAGPVSGAATLELQFKTDQINDVLKSMVVLDGGGSVSEITYGSQQPLDRALAGFAVDVTPGTLHQFLERARGAEVSIQAPDPLTGKILSVDWQAPIVESPDADLREYFVNLVTADGIQAVSLRRIDSLRFTDPKLQDDLQRALDLIAASRNTDTRPVAVHFGSPEKSKATRSVRVGYLVETPVWKTSYRLDLSATKPLLQGWAIVENTTDTDWTNLTLSLVSGRPISFVQDLYTPLYVDRPVVTPPSYASLRPRIYDEGIKTELEIQALREANEASRAGQVIIRGLPLAPKAMAAEVMADGAGGAMRLEDAPPAAASGGRIGELFQFTIDHPIDIPRQQSAMLPIINQAVQAEKVSIYNRAALAKHPLAGVYLTNDTDLSLLAGPVTVFDGGSYAGDAQLDDMTAGERRLLSYAIDLDVTVDPSDKSSARITAAKIVRGVLYLTRLTELEQVYAIKNKADAKKQILIEHPYQAGRELVAPTTYEEKTPTLYRFRVPVDADSSGKFVVRETQSSTQTIALLDRPGSVFLAYASDKQISAKVRDALTKAAEMKNELSRLEEQAQQAERTLSDIKTGQDRLRENIRTVGQDSQLGKRYVAKLSAQEDQVEKLELSLDDLRQKIDEQRSRLAAYVNGLSVD